jgi:hypothetical protein
MFKKLCRREGIKLWTNIYQKKGLLWLLLQSAMPLLKYEVKLFIHPLTMQEHAIKICQQKRWLLY